MNIAIKVIYIFVSVVLIWNAISIDSWLQFIDLWSLGFVLTPTLLAYWVDNSNTFQLKLRTVVKVAWLSGFVGSLIGLVRVFSHYEVDVLGILMGLSVAILPVLYSAVIALLLTPFLGSCQPRSKYMNPSQLTKQSR